MFFGARSEKIEVNGVPMSYVTFGKGEQVLVMIPGLSDGLQTVAGKDKILATYYKQFAKDYKVYVFSRKDELPDGYTTRDMASDQSVAMELLGIDNAFVFGISQGGMIAQYLAIDYPDKVEKLVLGVTVAKQTDTLQSVVGSWIEMAKNNDYKSLSIDTIEKTYTEKALKRYRPMYPALSRIGKPKSFERFLIQANACLTHNAYDELHKIKCPTLVLGGDDDKVVGHGTSEFITEQITGCQFVIYEELGHGSFEETKDFNLQILSFLK